MNLCKKDNCEEFEFVSGTTFLNINLKEYE